MASAIHTSTEPSSSLDELDIQDDGRANEYFGITEARRLAIMRPADMGSLRHPGDRRWKTIQDLV